MQNSSYADILELPHHQSETRAHMPLRDRAAQFSSFAALTGYEEEVAEAARLTQEKPETDEHEIDRLNRALSILYDRLAETPAVTVSYFVPDEKKDGGSFVTVSASVVRMDPARQILTLADGKDISFEDIRFLDSPLFSGFSF